MGRYKLLFLLFILGCKTSVDSKFPQAEIQEADSIKSEIYKVTINKKSAELIIDSLYFDSVFINNHIPLKLPEKELIIKLGKPDSVVMEHGWECGNYISDADSVTVYYYGRSKFIASSGIALLHTLVLSDKLLSFNTSKFSFSSPVSESEIKEMFPIAYSNLREEKNSNTNIDERRITVGMIESPRFDDYSGFIFYFEEQMLVKIELWWFIC